MILRLVLRHIGLRPVRSLVFVGAYAAGVAVMLALLSIGEVMVEQSRDEEWVGGGDVTVLPAGVDLETLRLGGAVFYGIEAARFIAREIIGGPRLASQIDAVAPWLDDRAVYLRRDTSEAPVAVRASGQIPSAARALEAEPDVIIGEWRDDSSDRRWLDPTALELYSEIDRFHLPPERARGDSTWAEWHYFNLLWPEANRWLYLSYILRGDVTSARWGGVVLASYRTPDGRSTFYSDRVRAEAIRFSTASPDVTFGPHSVRLIGDPVSYQIRARLAASAGGAPLDIEVEIHPRAHGYLPPAELAAGDALVSGYVVPALRARASGRICSASECLSVQEAIAYHDHNWGTWGGVSWDWGIAHAGDFDVLYGGVHDEARARPRRAGARFIAFVTDSLGAAAVLETRELVYSGERVVRFENETLSAPQTLFWTAPGGADSIRAAIDLEHISLSRLALGGESSAYFAQMQGVMELSGRLAGRPITARGPGFFETFLSR